MAERELPKLETGVRFPSPAPLRPDLATLREHQGSGRTELEHRAVLAPRPAGLTDLAPEPDQSDVQRHADLGGHQLLQEPMRFVGARPGFDETEARRDAVDVRVDRERVPAE